MPRVSVVIPTYNESGTIGTLLNSLLEHQGSYDLRIIIVDDGSTDGTQETIREIQQLNRNITVLQRGRKLGFGTAITDGLEIALSKDPKPDLIATMDADLSHDPHQLLQLIKQCTRDTVVIGSRYIPGGEIHGWGRYRKTVSWGANFLARIFSNIPAKDCTSGYRCYGADLIQAILPSLESTGYDIQIEILAEAGYQGFEIKEIPIRFQDRTTGESKLKSDQIWQFAKRIYKLFRKSYEWMRIIKFSIVGFSGVIVNETILWVLTEKIGLYYLYSGIVSSEAAVLNNFFWNNRWTFQDKVKTSIQRLSNRLVKFHVSRFSSLIIGFIILAFLTEVIKIHYLISNIVSIIMVLSINYITSKGWVWG